MELVNNVYYRSEVHHDSEINHITYFNELPTTSNEFWIGSAIDLEFPCNEKK